MWVFSLFSVKKPHLAGFASASRCAKSLFRPKEWAFYHDTVARRRERNAGLGGPNVPNEASLDLPNAHI